MKAGSASLYVARNVLPFDTKNAVTNFCAELYLFPERVTYIVEKCAPGASGNVFYLRRLYSYHPSNTDFRRMLALVNDVRLLLKHQVAYVCRVQN